MRFKFNAQTLSIVIMAIGVLALAGAGYLIYANVTDDGYSGPETVIGFEVPTQAPQPTPTAPPSEAALDHLVIPRFGVDAPIITLGLDGNGVMEAPDGPTDVAWYDFSARPGFGGNAVFAGHVDYINYGAAVFYNIGQLQANDVVQIRLADGTTYDYAVKEVHAYSADSAPVNDIVGQTPTEVVTLITCGGTFSSATHQYDERVVVRAQRVATDAVPASGAGAVAPVP